MAEEGNRTGHHAAVRAAAQELRVTGRRLRPLAGTEWDGLSEREHEVAQLLLDGLTNADIAATLYVSPHTVRVHVSRVLAAFGVASRFALAARAPAPLGVAAEGLTERQRAVVAELATGASNAEIAARLGISVKTVEKHLHEIMRPARGVDPGRHPAPRDGARGRRISRNPTYRRACRAPRMGG